MTRSYSRVSPEIWRSSLFDELGGDLAAKLVAVWCVTSSDANPVGTYRVHVARMALEVGCDHESALAALGRLQGLGFLRMARADSGLWLYVPKLARYQFDPCRGPSDNRTVRARELAAKVLDSPFLGDLIADHAAYLALPPELATMQSPCSSEGYATDPSQGSPPDPSGPYARAPAPTRPRAHTHTHTHTHDQREGGSSTSHARVREAPPPALPSSRPPVDEHPLAGFASTRPAPVCPGTEREWCGLTLEGQVSALWWDLPVSAEPSHSAYVTALRAEAERTLQDYARRCEAAGGLCDHEADTCISRAVLWWTHVHGLSPDAAGERVRAVVAWAETALTEPVGRMRQPAWRLPRVLFGDAKTAASRMVERWNACEAWRPMRVVASTVDLETRQLVEAIDAARARGDEAELKRLLWEFDRPNREAAQQRAAAGGAR